jgi:hypothetical protein
MNKMRDETQERCDGRGAAKELEVELGRAGKALRASESNYRTLLENPRAVKLLGFPYWQ